MDLPDAHRSTRGELQQVLRLERLRELAFLGHVWDLCLVDEDEVLADERSTCAPAHVRVGIAHVAQGRLTDELTQNFFKP